MNCAQKNKKHFTWQSEAFLSLIGIPIPILTIKKFIEVKGPHNVRPSFMMKGNDFLHQ